MKLLLIEDNAIMQATLQRSFERRGIHVTTCGDGARTLPRWRASLPDVVRLDLSLSVRDGLQVLADAGADGLITPVINLTARGTVGNRILGLNTGADDYLPKPFDLDELEARMRALARSGQAVAMERLFDLVFAGEPDLQPDSIEVVAYRLRKRLAATAARVVTLRGLGYLLKADG